MRSPGVSAPADAAQPAAPAPPPPSAPPPHRLRRLAAPVALGLFVLLVSAYVLTVALDTNKFTSVDELLVLEGGRLLADDFWFWITDTSFFVRGPERLTSVIIALPSALFDTTPDQLRGAHVLLTLVYFLAAFPLYGLMRGVGVSRGPAALGAAAAVVGPWVLYGATMLNVTTGFPLTAAFAWAAWRAASRPSVLGDVLVIAAAAANTLARTGHVPFAAVAVLAVVYATWISRPAGEAAGRSLLRLPMRLARRHPLLTAVAVAGALVLVVLGPARAVGSAYAPLADLRLPLEGMWNYAGHWLAYLSIACGVIPVLVGVPWLVRQIARPRSVETGTLGVVILGLFAVWVYVTANHTTQLEERYVAVLGGLATVAFAAAVFRRETWLAGTAVMSVLVGLALVARSAPNIGAEPFGYFVSPGRLFLDQVVLGRLDVALPGGRGYLLELVAVGAGILGLLVAFAAGRGARRLPGRLRPPAAFTTVLLVPFLLLGLAMGQNVLERYKPATLPELSFERMAWIEKASEGDRAVVWAYDVGTEGPGRRYLAQLATYFNDNTCCGYWANDMPGAVGPDGKVPPRGATPEVLVRFTGYHPLGFATTTEATSTTYGPYELRAERFRGPPEVAFSFDGPDPTGRLARDATARIALRDPARAAGGCLTLDVFAGDPRRTSAYRLRAGSVTRAGTLRPGRSRTLSFPVEGVERASLAATGAALQLGEARIGPCRG